MTTPVYEIQISEREGVWGATLTMSNGNGDGHHWTSPWKPVDGATDYETAAEIFAFEVRRLARILNP